MQRNFHHGQLSFLSVFGYWRILVVCRDPVVPADPGGEVLVAAALAAERSPLGVRRTGATDYTQEGT
jgi:hypothetical protein